MGMFSKVGMSKLGGIAGLFKGKKKAVTDPAAAVPPIAMGPATAVPPVAMDPATAVPPVAMDPTATPSDVPLVTQPTDSPFAAVATAAAAKMPAKKTMATPVAAPGKKRFGQMVRPKAY